MDDASIKALISFLTGAFVPLLLIFWNKQKEDAKKQSHENQSVFTLQVKMIEDITILKTQVSAAWKTIDELKATILKK